MLSPNCIQYWKFLILSQKNRYILAFRNKLFCWVGVENEASMRSKVLSIEYLLGSSLQVEYRTSKIIEKLPP